MNAGYIERPLVFECQGERLIGILSLPATPRPRGVLILVGGPQYRVGSHRQFVLLARCLAAAGIACMRFDYRGMGDSTGAPRSFESVEDDLLCALRSFLAQVPSLEQVVLWGLCDAASAALMFGVRHRQVSGLMLFNPWVRSDATFSRTRIKHYYAGRLLDRELWRKVRRGEIAWRASLAEFARTLSPAVSSVFAGTGLRVTPPPSAMSGAPTSSFPPFQARMAAALMAFKGRVLIFTSGNDLTAKEFIERATQEMQWRKAVARPGVSRLHLEAADHTFSRQAWREAVERATLQWLESW